MSSFHLASSAYFDAPYDDPEKTQLHLYFNHSGILCGPDFAFRNEDLLYVLNKVWCKFGTVNHTYAFVTYSTHAEAKAAFHCMRDHSFFRMVIAEVNATLNVDDQAILDKVFFSRFNGVGGLVLPSWANKENSFHAEAGSFTC